MRQLARCRISIGSQQSSSSVSIIICQGSVLDFKHERGAIVNAANERCLGGGGIDAAISKAGASQLLQDRLALPVVSTKQLRNGVEEIRCPTGEAKITGPGTYGQINVPYVIHAVGPCYFDFKSDQYEGADKLLKAAYQDSLRRSEEAGLEAIAFCLISAGVFSGRRDLTDIVKLGLEAICQFDEYEKLNDVYLFGYSRADLVALQNAVIDLDLDIE